MTTAHTPTPWKVREYKYGKDYTGVIETMEGIYLGEMSCTMGQTKEEVQTLIANAAFIVKAVNSHSSLVATLHHIQDLAEENTHSVQDGYCQIAEWARNQIAKAEGK